MGAELGELVEAHSFDFCTTVLQGKFSERRTISIGLPLRADRATVAR